MRLRWVSCALLLVTTACAFEPFDPAPDFWLSGARQTNEGPAIVVGLCPGKSPTRLELSTGNSEGERVVIWAVEATEAPATNPPPVTEFLLGVTPDGFAVTHDLRTDLDPQEELGVRVLASNNAGFTDLFRIDELAPEGTIGLPSGKEITLEEFEERSRDLPC